MFDKAQFVEEMHTQGYSIVPDVLSPEFIQKAKAELMQAIDKEAAYHGGTGYKDYGMVAALLNYSTMHYSIPVSMQF